MTKPIIYRPDTCDLGYTFGHRVPVATLRPGNVLLVDTEDCFGGAVRTVGDLPSQVCQFPFLNPVSGPFFIDGAEIGDTLAVHFAELIPTRDWGVSSTFPHFGALTGTHTTAMLHPALEERVWRYDIDLAAQLVRYHARTSDYTVDLPLQPMIGTVGVAPGGFEARSTIDAGTYGGNLDIPYLRAGTTLYLPVLVHGALLSLGDGHARQGDGEVSGVAIETALRTTLTVEVVKSTGAATARPRIETDAQIMSIGSARPLDDAFRISQHDLTGWVAQLTGLDTLDALQLVAQAGTAPVANVVDPAYTMLAALDKSVLHGAQPYGAVHQRLRTHAQSVAAGARP